jgi:hypothetical protein
MKKIILLLLIVVLAACSFGASNEFERNRQTWQSAGITHYRFELVIGCFCPFRNQMPITVEVQNEKIVSITYPDGTLVAESDPNYKTFSQYATIDRVFAELESGLAKAEKTTVTYDSTYGFPTEIHFDYIIAAMDDEFSLGISKFETLK